MALANQTARALRLLAIGRLGGQIANWAATLVVIRLLAPEDYALMALAVMFTSFASLVSELGISNALVQRTTISQRLLQQSYGLLLLLSGGIVLLLLALAAPAAAFFETPELSGIVMLLALQFPLTAVGAIPHVLLRRDMQFGRKAAVEFTSMIVGSGCTLALAWMGYGVWALVIGNLAMVTARSVGFHIARSWLHAPQFRSDESRTLLTYGGHVTLESLVWAIYSQADVFLVGKFLGQSALGAYAIVMQIATLPMQKLSTIINEVGLSALARLAHEPLQFRRQFLRALELTAALTFPVFFGISAVSGEFVGVFLGDKWLYIAPLLTVVAWALPLRMIAILLPTALQALGATYTSLMIRIPSSLIMIASFSIGLQWNVMGVAWAWALGFPLTLALGLHYSLPKFGISWADFMRQLYPFAAAAVLMWGAVELLRPVVAVLHPLSNLWLNQLLQLCILCSIGGLVYPAVAVLLRPSIVGSVRQLAGRGA